MYKVTVTNGIYNAPVLYVEASNYGEAAEKARQRFGLGRFENWQFKPTRIK